MLPRADVFCGVRKRTRFHGDARLPEYTVCAKHMKIAGQQNLAARHYIQDRFRLERIFARAVRLVLHANGRCRNPLRNQEVPHAFGDRHVAMNRSAADNHFPEPAFTPGTHGVHAAPIGRPADHIAYRVGSQNHQHFALRIVPGASQAPQPPAVNRSHRRQNVQEPNGTQSPPDVAARSSHTFSATLATWIWCVCSVTRPSRSWRGCAAGPRRNRGAPRCDTRGVATGPSRESGAAVPWWTEWESVGLPFSRLLPHLFRMPLP